MSGVPAIVPRSAGSAGTPLKPLSRATTAAAAFRASATAAARPVIVARPATVRTASAIIPSAIASAAAKWSLKTLPRISAHSRGIPWKFFAGSRRAARTARCPRLSGKQNHVFLRDGRYGRGRNQRVDRNFIGVRSFRRFLPVQAFRVPSPILLVRIRVLMVVCISVSVVMLLVVPGVPLM